ncbi:tyrosine-protein kinase Fer isoform X3 [Ixodes scapularis]|uniref:Tyrosine-protein kinase n=4 Tax=Ixodes TaxID=6944 RepID=V5IJ18_IXORI|nr:tyrosine-protein kinase Fer isoform X3 [Ixodes scapularis]
MGFATELQGWSSHDALLSVQDAELRLLENMRRCIVNRVKCDREYSISLNSLCIQAAKVDTGDELSGSLIAKAWNTIIDTTETVGRLVKQNADLIATHTLDKLSCLILEKRALRKIYLEEHQRIHGELARLRDAVLKSTSEYEKCIENATAAKEKYEDQFMKGSLNALINSSRGNRKVEEAKERYLKASRKLHQTHNDYILLLNEAMNYEHHLRTTLLPGLLQYQQTVQQEAIDCWQAVMRDYSRHTDFCSEAFQSVHKKLNESIDFIKSESEYQDFIEKYKSKPIPPIDFHYDESLLNNYVGKLKPEQIAVDEFTIDALRERISDLQTRLVQAQAAILEKETQLAQFQVEVSEIKTTPDLGSAAMVKKRAVDIIRRERDEIKCQEERINSQLQLLVQPLSSIGSEVPRGLDLDITVNGEQVKDDEIMDFTTISKIAARHFVDRLKSPFLKKQAIPTPQPKDFEECVNSNNFFEETNSTHHQAYSRMSVNPNVVLQDEDWFHGVLPREEVVRLLVNNGDYLVRETMRNEEKQVVLSVCWQGHKHFIVQTTSDGKYRFEGPAFGTVQELIVYQHHLGLPVTSKSGAILQNPIFRERWELNNDDVELVEKIGRGNFGDVYRAVLHPQRTEVAVKTCRVNLPDEHKKKFLQEGRILKQYDHPNIVKFIGICVQKQPIMIVMELVPGGSLLAFLRNQGPKLNPKELLNMCIDTAAGMAYLESKNCIHRDLAARNCLVGRNNTVKISDFGMSREEEEYIVSDGMKQIPIKWTAPEALNFGKYTSVCDVWSYGILAWEIFSLGASPYCGMSNSRARELIDTGYRLPSPEHTPGPVYELMLRCWEYNPDKRPSFYDIHHTLVSISKHG